MRHHSWRILPLLLAHGIAREESPEPHDAVAQQVIKDSQTASESATWDEKAHVKSDGGYTEQDDKSRDAVREATTILRKIRPPTLSKLAKYAQKPKGVVGTTVYYAKEAFIFMFMNAPKNENLISTTTPSRPAELAQPLSKAVRLLEDAANENDADAMYLLAEMNFHGNYTHPINHAQAFKWYKQLAELDGNSTAQYMLGFMYGTGLSPAVPADQAKSMLYHTFAAEQGNTRSEMTLGYRYHAGIATPRNCDEAVHWYQRVADKAILYYRSGPPGGHSLVKDSFPLSEEVGGVYGEGASVSSAGIRAKQGGPTSDAYADVEDVLEYLHFQSSKGDIKATFGLARLHYDGGKNLPRDFKLAKSHFMDVARQYWDRNGKVKSEVPAHLEKLAAKAAGYLGRMFLRGEGMEQSFGKAKIWFMRGLANGDALCQYSLGLMYLEGLGVEQNIQKAADFFAAAADQDLAVAQTKLGILFLDQGEVGTATQYFELAARNSHIEAFYYLAELNNQGIGRQRSCGMAAVYYKIVAEKAEAIWASLPEAIELVAQNQPEKALVPYLMAAECGSETAQANVAYLLDHTQPRWSPVSYISSLAQSKATTDSRSTTETRNDATMALIYYTRSAKQNNIDSMVKMGDHYLSGLGTLLSPENAASCYQAAAETLQSAQAMWNLGWMHENGIGSTQDFHLAKRFYDQALETNKEAYLPVKLGLWRLGWRSWWNSVSGGSINGIQDEESARKRRSLAQWVEDFLRADAEMYAEQYEADDWDAQDPTDPMPGGDDHWDSGDEIDDDVLVTVIIGGLVAGLGWLLWYRQREAARAAEARRQQQQQQGQAGQAPVQPVPGQQPDGGFFPQAGQLGFNDWVAGGVGH